jgi:hypothetical protein
VKCFFIAYIRIVEQYDVLGRRLNQAQIIAMFFMLGGGAGASFIGRYTGIPVPKICYLQPE